MVAAAHIATAAQIIPSWSQRAPDLRAPAPPNGICICSAVIAGITGVPNRKTQTHTNHAS